ncbi:MAG TPA: hypothetical protein VE911_10380 [Candidatus Nitrosopolaris sp.]|nr:hypothetical protein [Candidatus Nitrosopolaris sp.]
MALCCNPRREDRLIVAAGIGLALGVGALQSSAIHYCIPTAAYVRLASREDR